MFCEKCGTEIPDNAKFCEKCGALVELELQEHKEEVSHKKWILGGIISGIAVVAVVVVLLFATGVLGGKEETVQTSKGGGVQPDTEVSDAMAHPTELSKEIEIDISAKSVVLIDNNNGQLIYEKNKNMELALTGITKTMMCIIIFDAIDQGIISPEDEVTISEYAASINDYSSLEAQDTQTVDAMIKYLDLSFVCDVAAVALAEKIAGSEQDFVKKMNQKAQELDMQHTQFNTCRISAGNYENFSSAYDVALMSCELAMKYPQIYDYPGGVLTDSIENGEDYANKEEFVRSGGIMILMKGITGNAEHCFSAISEREGVKLTAVVMGDDNHWTEDAQNLLDAGFANLVE